MLPNKNKLNAVEDGYDCEQKNIAGVASIDIHCSNREAHWTGTSNETAEHALNEAQSLQKHFEDCKQKLKGTFKKTSEFDSLLKTRNCKPKCNSTKTLVKKSNPTNRIKFRQQLSPPDDCNTRFNCAY
ncbi:hypothetical protein T10_4572 [Trichinella papuae]|uniref:Uncharacterized protein n=1 Tax=Trichinella papuae TaxID=268474 RepID=A0A0V1MHX5_9BILA|nr:hypothetical protein T10_4572 [Trichinella papuae]